MIDLWRLTGQVQRGGLAQQFDQFLVDDLDDLLGRGQAVHHLFADRTDPDARNKVFDDFEVYVGFEQGKTNLAQRDIDVVLAKFPLPGQPVKDGLEFVGQALEHGLVFPLHLA